MAKKKNVPKVQTPNSRIPNQDLPRNNVKFSFYYDRWLKSYSSSDFTNYLNSENMYGKYITELFNIIIPKITKDWSPKTQSSQFLHCHKVGNDRAFRRYSKAIEAIHQIQTDQLDLWQFGFTGSLRIIAHLSGDNTIYPLLIDYHHLGYDSIKYNGIDRSHYSFCPIDNYSRH
ncbi:hypothetical protein P7G31_02220 [Streptococcus parauberis]|uniref:Uncharacterized protein n=1 Tax=Streptococcus parauberis TaxID=1348 RepID=A0AAE4L0B1_9STRE|nr:hypothetical protein [Streptococcus parauberis]MDT2731070.1 hypothetical protein [Streptococcus parauberis]MDT2749810.1 hypothetical protein [Streptococcus parauberis]